MAQQQQQLMSGTAPAGGLFRFDSRSPIRFVGLFSLLCFGWGLFLILWSVRWNLVALWAATELCVYVFYWRPRYAELNAQPKPHRPKRHNAVEPWQRTLRYFRETNDVDVQGYVGGWFCGAKLKDIKRGNAEEFLAYAFWFRTLQEMQDEGLGDVPAAMVSELEETWGIPFTDGYNPDLKFMGHLWEPLKAQWRPLAFYLATEGVGWAARQLLKRWGFQHHTHKGMTYFTLNFKSQAELSRTISASRSSSASSALSDSTVASYISTAPAAATTGAAATQGPALTALAAAATAAATSGAAAPSIARPKSTPFAAAGTDWAAAQLAADGDLLAASISAASAVHSTPAPAAPAPAGRHNVFAAAAAAAASAVASTVSGRRSRRSSRRRVQIQQPQQQAQPQQAAPLNPWLSSHTSMMLRTLPNPLEDALSGGLGSHDMPVLFLHGVGGLPAYLEMLLQVMALGHPLIVVQFDGVAMRPSQVQTADEVVAGVIGVLDKLGVEEACVVGHSYGTFIAGRLARLHRKRVRSLCLIDPVCFGMFMPQLLSNFLYNAPKWRGLHHLVDYVKKSGVYIASHELHVCATFSRGFFWSDLNLWPEDLAPGSVVLLSGRDDLMNARQVQAMLTRAGHIKVHYNQELTHGEFLVRSEVKAAIMDEVRGMLARSGSAVVELARPVLQTTMTLARNALEVTAAIRMHKGSSGARYVEDHANKLVRTFTGNLTMLQTITTIKPSFSIPQHQAISSSGGSNSSNSSSHHRLSNLGPRQSNGSATSAAGAWPQQPHSTSAAGAASLSAGGTAAAAGATDLPHAFSLPVQRRPNFRHVVANSSLSQSGAGAGNSSNRSGETRLAPSPWEQPSQVTFAADRPASPCSKGQQKPAAAGSSYSHSSKPKRGVLLVRRRTSSYEGRRSSGSGSVQRKVLGAEAAGVQVVPDSRLDAAAMS